MRGRGWGAVAALSLLVGVIGCASADERDPATASPAVDAPLSASGAAIPALLESLGNSYECQEVSISADTWEDRRPLSELSATRQSILEQAMLEPEGAFDADQWFVVEDTPGLLSVMRETSVAGNSSDEAWFTGDHDLVRITASEGVANLDEGWVPIAYTTCPLTVPLGGLDTVGVWLDPAHPPQPTDRALQLLVVEGGCHDADAVAAAIDVVDVAEDAATIAVALGVQAFSGPQPACTDGPLVPITVELEHPIGDRTIVDGAFAATPEIVQR